MMNQPKFSQNIKRGMAATAPYMVFSLDTKICVSRKRYCIIVNTGPDRSAALNACLYSTTWFGMNLYIAENVRTDIAPNMNQPRNVLMLSEKTIPGYSAHLNI